MTSEHDWDWAADHVDEGSQKELAEEQLQKFGQFLQDYGRQLSKIEQALEDKATETWDFTLNQIILRCAPREDAPLLQLMDTDNKILNKVVTVLTSLCKEINLLVHEACNRFYNPLLFYGEGVSDTTETGFAYLMIGRILPLLQAISCFVHRSKDVLQNIIQQLAALYHSNKSTSKLININKAHFQVVFEHIGTLLITLITLDAIIENQTLLQPHWLQYKRMVKLVRHDPAKFNTSLNVLPPLENLLLQLEEDLLTGKIFQKCINQTFDTSEVSASKNSVFAEEFTFVLRGYLSEIEERLGEKTELDTSLQLVGAAALYVLHFAVFQSVDKKLFKTIWDLHKKVPAVTLCGNVMWYLDRFLLSHLPHMARAIDKRVEQTAQTNRLNHLQQKTQGLSKDLQILNMQAVIWMVRFDSVVSSGSNQLKLDDLKYRSNLLTQGVQLSFQIGNMVRTLMNLHVSLNKPMMKTSVLLLCRLIEVLKMVYFTFHRHNFAITESVSYIIQHTTYLILKMVESAQKSLTSNKSYSDTHLDLLSALHLAKHSLQGPSTADRRLIARLSLSIAAQQKTFTPEEVTSLNLLFKKLELMGDLWEKLDVAANCDFLYWHRVILPIYITDVYTTRTDVHRIHYIIASLHDSVEAVKASKHAESPQHLLTQFEEEVYSYLKQQLLEPLCQDIETDLRLQTHSHLQLDDRNPFRTGLQDLLPFLHLRPIGFFDRLINVRGIVEQYLGKNFYNLTTVALHDWKSYAEMRCLAKQKYGLHTVEDHLPSQTLEQGLDVLEIMRNIHVFVSRYFYNLNNQIFIEQSSNNKHLNTINIGHIANSIRTHGTGIMNTTVNFTYQFLRKKFYIFSQFMFDEHIKSRLIKDLRYFRENKTELGQKYPFDRAEKMNRGIRKLGLTPDGQSFLDQFRILITHIGNAVGYIRMVRSGGLHCCSSAICFIPDLEDIVSFEELCKQENLSEECQEAAQQLDNIIGNLSKNFAEGTEYFQLLVEVFKAVFQDPKNMHLRNFYIIVPPLTINFIEHLISCKEKMSRKNKVGATFTDDGFAMGVAYILKLLDQYSEFDSLHWFQSVKDKYINEQTSAEQQQKKSGRNDEKLEQTVTLTLNRISKYQQEFNLLDFNLTSARIFFRTDPEKVSSESK